MRCCAASEQLSRSQKTNKDCDRENCIKINFVTCTHHHVTAVIKPRKIQQRARQYHAREIWKIHAKILSENMEGREFLEDPI